MSEREKETVNRQKQTAIQAEKHLVLAQAAVVNWSVLQKSIRWNRRYGPVGQYQKKRNSLSQGSVFSVWGDEIGSCTVTKSLMQPTASFPDTSFKDGTFQIFFLGVSSAMNTLSFLVIFLKYYKHFHQVSSWFVHSKQLFLNFLSPLSC